MQTRNTFQSIGELDQLRELARGASIEIVQLKPGTMQGVLAHVDLGRSSIHLNHFNLPARGRGAVSSDRWTFVVFPAEVDGRFNGQPLAPDILLAYPPGGDFEGTISGEFQDLVFTSEYGELSRMCEVITQQSMPKLATGVRALRPDSAHLKQLRDFAGSTLSAIQACPTVLADHRVRQSLHVQLTQLLTLAVLSSSQDAGQQAAVPESHWRITRRAEDILEGSVADPVSLSDLCAVTDVSERTLRNAFLNVVGLSPQSYIKAIRLNRVRSKLERTASTSVTVASVALACGFSHFGRFASDYRRFFGELPSETRRKAIER